MELTNNEMGRVGFVEMWFLLYLYVINNFSNSNIEMEEGDFPKI